MTKPIDHTDPLHRLAYLAALWSADVRLRWIDGDYEVTVSHGVYSYRRSWRCPTASGAYALALADMERITAAEDAREAEGEVSR